MAGTEDITPERPRLVLHDYGMGELWWWVRARSAREVLETHARVGVITDPEDEEGRPIDQLVEVGPDGRRIRQVEVAEDGTGVRGSPDD
jgi:hypothetical protein